METYALLLLDYQNAVCKGVAAAEVERRGVLGNAARCLAAARSNGVPVIHVRVGFDREHSLRTNRSQRFEGLEQSGKMLLGTSDTEFCDEVKPIAGEPIVTKGCVNPFIGTPLLELLVGRRIGELYLAGVATNAVVESTLRHAADTGFAVTVIEDCCASFDQAMHDFAMTKIFPMYGSVCSSQDFVAVAGTAPKAT